jgi:hypothetical protein
MRPKVYVALPARPGENMALGLHFALEPQRMGEGFDIVGPRSLPCSMLPLSFNMLWCEALNSRSTGITHFVMVHSDVVPQGDRWLQNALDVHRRSGGDITSSVIAIKDTRGQSSTGVMNIETREMRKLTLAECHGIGKKTFNAADAGFPGHCLLMNTGLLVCDFTKPWVEKMCFRFHDHVVKQSDGMWRAACVGEDWLFSIDAWRLGLKTFVTLEIPIHHLGVYEYPNEVAWGTKEADTSFAWNIEPPASWNWQESPIRNIERQAIKDAEIDRLNNIADSFGDEETLEVLAS